jgi:eukaryotic-like serine/threonine-protein kinase
MNDDPFAPGYTIAAGYEVISHLSRGNDLDVYDVWSDRRGCRCVAKTLRPRRVQDSSVTARLLEEGRRLQRLAHPHIVRGYETIEAPQPVAILETLSGETLSHMIQSSGPLDASECVHLGLQLGAATQYLHAEGIVHLDLKPSNVIAQGGRAKLLDLSVARPPGVMRADIGTWCYMAPEQVRGGFVDEAADVWGLGVVLFEAASGVPAFEEESHASGSGGDGSDQHTGRDASAVVTPIRDVASVPGSLADLVTSCLAPDPAQRPRVRDLLAALERSGDLPASERHWGAP